MPAQITDPAGDTGRRPISADAVRSNSTDSAASNGVSSTSTTAPGPGTASRRRLVTRVRQPGAAGISGAS